MRRLHVIIRLQRFFLVKMNLTEMRASIFIILSLLFVLCSASGFKSNPETGFIEDQYGRSRIFHGVNVVYKLFPYYPRLEGFDPFFSFSEEDMQNLQNWGFNVIRLFVAWEGVEPYQGQYNYTYLEELMKIVKRCDKYNIHVLLDAHQDALARKFCGEGLPTWAASNGSFPAPLDFNISFDTNGMPNLTECLSRNFFDYNSAYDVQDTYVQLYHNATGLQLFFANFWGVVADYFKNESNVVGYELLNEPFPSDIYTNKWLSYFPFLTDINDLTPLYTAINEKIRAVDNETIVFFEPCVDDHVLVGFTEGPGGADYRDRQVFSYHVYCPFDNSAGQPDFPLGCEVFYEALIALRVSAAKLMGVPGFMTEFGAVANTTQNADEALHATEVADSHFQSWIYWQFKYFDDITTSCRPGSLESFYNPDGTLQEYKVNTLSKPYAYAICGVPRDAGYNNATSEYTLEYFPAEDCQGMKTELYLNEPVYFNQGFDVAFVGCDECQLELIDGLSYYQIVLPPGFRSNGSIAVTITSH